MSLSLLACLRAAFERRAQGGRAVLVFYVALALKQHLRHLEVESPAGEHERGLPEAVLGPGLVRKRVHHLELHAEEISFTPRQRFRLLIRILPVQLGGAHERGFALILHAALVRDENLYSGQVSQLDCVDKSRLFLEIALLNELFGNLTQPVVAILVYELD